LITKSKNGVIELLINGIIFYNYNQIHLRKKYL
jgi:hypothetical protein